MQTITVDFIKVLIEVGVPLTIINEMNRNRSPQSVLALLAQQENKLDAQLLKLQTAYSIVHTYRNNLQAGMYANENDIAVRELDEAHFILGQKADFGDTDTFYKPFMEFCNAAHENKINLNYPIGGYYEDIHAFLNAPSKPTRFFSQDPRGNSKRKAGRYLVAYTRGYYGEFGDLPQKISAYAQKHAFSFCGSLYITYLLDEISITNHRQYLSQIVVGVSQSENQKGQGHSVLDKI
jgi:effector-binding domain-containing protein